MIVPIILAAGASSRMGWPKALSDFDGRCALELVLDACALPACTSPIVVLGHSADRISPVALQRNAHVVVNPHPEQGQTSSLQQALAALPAHASAFLLFPVDYPAVTSADVLALSHAFANNPQAHVVALSYQGRRGHPVLVSSTLVPALLRLTSAQGARDVINNKAVNTFYIHTSNPGVVMDMDTPQDYAQLLAIHRDRFPQAP